MPYNTFKQKGIWHVKNKRTGQIINVPSAKSYEDAFNYGRLREAYKHGFKPTKVKIRKHLRGGHKVKEHVRGIKKRKIERLVYPFNTDSGHPYGRKMVKLVYDKEIEDFEANHPKYSGCKVSANTFVCGFHDPTMYGEVNLSGTRGQLKRFLPKVMKQLKQHPPSNKQSKLMVTAFDLSRKRDYQY